LKVLLTGSSGFVGGAIANTLSASSVDLILPVRSGVEFANSHRLAGQKRIVPAINGATDWASCLKGVKTVVHCAAVVEMMKSLDLPQLHALRSVNVDGTLNLARQAAASGVRRFVFLSSIKVNGDSTRPGKPFTDEDTPLPADSYGLSKLQAEKGLQNISQNMGMDFVIIRPPLVYGPGVKGNFAMMMKLVDYGFPLPLSNIRNQRSFIGVDNLVDLVIACISHPEAANKILLASDDQDLSTTELLRAIAQTMGKPIRLFPFPKQLLTVAAKCVGKTGITERLLGSLQVDVTRTKHLLGWVPPVEVEDGLRRCFRKV
jgi:nucleoside-diphosphate-sugar epimerase